MPQERGHGLLFLQWRPGEEAGDGLQQLLHAGERDKGERQQVWLRVRMSDAGLFLSKVHGGLR